jgi:hypothetical protein
MLIRIRLPVCPSGAGLSNFAHHNIRAAPFGFGWVGPTCLPSPSPSRLRPIRCSSIERTKNCAAATVISTRIAVVIDVDC